MGREAHREVHGGGSDGSAVLDARHEELLALARDLYTRQIDRAAPVAREAAVQNLEHVDRMIDRVRRAGAELRRIGVDLDALVVGIAISDIGKGALGEIIDASPDLTDDDQHRAFLRHEQHGPRLLTDWARQVGLSTREQLAIVRANTHHNGPGLRGTWWGDQYRRAFGHRYGMPFGLEGVVHTLLDRVDGATLALDADAPEPGLVGGPAKIAREVERRGASLGEIVVGAMFATIRDARRQLEALRRCAGTGGVLGSRSRPVRGAAKLFASAFCGEAMDGLTRSLELLAAVTVECEDGRVVRCEDRFGDVEADVLRRARVCVHGVQVDDLDALLVRLAQGAAPPPRMRSVRSGASRRARRRTRTAGPARTPALRVAYAG
jgi:hypothetical protein